MEKKDLTAVAMRKVFLEGKAVIGRIIITGKDDKDVAFALFQAKKGLIKINFPNKKKADVEMGNKLQLIFTCCPEKNKKKKREGILIMKGDSEEIIFVGLDDIEVLPDHLQ